MRIFLVALIAAAVAFAAWQRRTLVALRVEEARIVSEFSHTEIHTVTRGQHYDNAPQNAPAPAVTDAEMASFTAVVLAVKDEFETDRWYKLSDENGMSHPVLSETLCRLTTAQLRSVVDAWAGNEVIEGDRETGIHRFMLLAGKVNPSAAIPLMYEWLKERGKKRLFGAPGQAFQNWFRQDADGLLNWAREAGMPEGFDGLCATWADAVVAAREPSVENVRRLGAHQFGWDNWARNEVVLKLPTPDARLTFFQNLHAATGGVCDDVGNYVWQLAQRIPFAQLTHLADNTPAFKPSKPEREEALGGDKEQLGSLRLEVAATSRDATAAQRWEWLTQSEEDRPSGKLLGRLVKAWCKNDYPDTAAWVRALPPGPERDTATKEVIAFLKYNGATNLVPEWQSP